MDLLPNIWSRWFDTDDQARLVLSSFIALVAVTWILILLVKKSSNQNPPPPPGPRGLPLLGNLLSLDPELHAHFAGLARAHGPIYTLRFGGKAGVVVTSPAIAREVLREHDAVFANRDVPVAGREATYGGRDIVWTPYGPQWRLLRKVCVREMLGGATLDAVYALRRRELRRTIGHLRRGGGGGAAVDVGEQMFLTVLNVITSMLWGGAGATAADEIGAEFKEVVGGMTALLGAPNLSDFFPALEWFDLQGIQKKMKVLVERFDRIFEKIIEQRLEKVSGDDDDESKDFLQILLKLKDTNGEANTTFTMTHVKALLMDMVVGGTDTTSNMVEFALAEIMNKPEIMKKVQQELEDVIGKDHIVEESHINKLPYLSLVMKEVLRLHPALPLLVPHCPSAPSVVAGYTIPKGARVFVNVWAIHRDPSIWENPLEFCPERFSDGKWDYSGNDFNYFPFGSGRRICAGIGMAERMFMYSLASLLHSFDWSVPPGEKLDLEEKFGIVLKKKLPLLAIPTPRLSHPSLYE